MSALPQPSSPDHSDPTRIFQAHRAALLHQLRALASRAKRAGELRHDFAIDDLVLVLLADRRLSSTRPATRIVAARRFAALALDAFRENATNGTLPRKPPLVDEAVRIPDEANHDDQLDVERCSSQRRDKVTFGQLLDEVREVTALQTATGGTMWPGRSGHDDDPVHLMG